MKDAFMKAAIFSALHGDGPLGDLFDDSDCDCESCKSGKKKVMKTPEIFLGCELKGKGAEIESLHSAISQLRGLYDEQTKRTDALTEERDKAQQGLSEARDEISDLQEEMSHHKARASELDKANSNLLKMYGDADEAVDGFRQGIAGVLELFSGLTAKTNKPEVVAMVEEAVERLNALKEPPADTKDEV